MTQTAFTELAGCRLPLQLAGMGGVISDVGLCAAVTNAGGLGMIGAGGLPVPALRSMLDAVAEAAEGPYGVNFLVPFLDPEAVRLAAGRSRVCDFHFGDPRADVISMVHAAGALAAWQVGSPHEAVAAAAAGCDFVIAQGVEAGGHVRGTLPLDDLLAQTIAMVDVPVVAAGGIGTAQRVRALIDAGAAGVRVGTRFVAATESPAHPDYVASLVAASADDTELTQTFGADWPDAPHRVLRSSIEAARSAGDVVATIRLGTDSWPVARFSSLPPTKDVEGNIAAMAQYAGTSVEHITTRQPATEIVAELCEALP